MTRYARVLFACILLLDVAFCRAAQRYAGPEGKSTNAGTRDEPWDIASALGGKQKIAAGDTLYLLEGTYRRRPNELFEVRLAGAEEKPIVMRPARGGGGRVGGGGVGQGAGAPGGVA